MIHKSIALMAILFTMQRASVVMDTLEGHEGCQPPARGNKAALRTALGVAAVAPFSPLLSPPLLPCRGCGAVREQQARQPSGRRRKHGIG